MCIKTPRQCTASNVESLNDRFSRLSHRNSTIVSRACLTTLFRAFARTLSEISTPTHRNPLLTIPIECSPVPQPASRNRAFGSKPSRATIRSMSRSFNLSCNGLRLYTDSHFSWISGCSYVPLSTAISWKIPRDIEWNCDSLGISTSGKLISLL